MSERDSTELKLPDPDKIGETVARIAFIRRAKGCRT